MLDVVRTIHPIGQGGFVSEYLPGLKPYSDHLVVYDCGTSTKLDKKYVYSIFDSLPKRDIDILFISHFDKDHVSLIPELKKWVESGGAKIDKVVIPLTSKNERMQLSQLSGDKALQSMILSPEKFFEDSVVVKVEPFTGHEEASEPIQEEELVRPKISSGTCIVGNDWEYIPFNFKRQTRRKQFLKACRSEKIDTRKLRNTEYVLSHITELQNVYKSSLIEGTINQNSMLLYSGSRNANVLSRIAWSDCRKCLRSWCGMCANGTRIDIRKGSCLYTGDCDWSTARFFFNHLKDRAAKIGAFQIPHHGSKGSYDNKARAFLNSLNADCFVQFGMENGYGHPSMDILFSGNPTRLLFLVTERGGAISPYRRCPPVSGLCYR